MLGSFDDFLLVISSFVGIKPRKQLVACFHFLILIHYIYIYKYINIYILNPIKQNTFVEDEYNFHNQSSPGRS
jgi:hypothetical protein